MTATSAEEHDATPTDTSSGAVGRVLGTEASTPLTFWVGLLPDQFVQLDDVFITQRRLPDGSDIRLSGVVTGVRARQEGAHFDSDVFLINDGVLPAQTIEAAEVLTTRVEPEVFVPPLPGAEVRRAAEGERDHALYFDQMRSKLSIGTGRDGDVLFANLEFLDGARGAHVNISGIFGVATKTTCATFLLYGLFHSDVLGVEKINTKALIFNVKGEDLLFLGHDNIELTEEDRERYRALRLPACPFDLVAVYAPPRRGDPTGRPDVATRSEGVHAYYWTLQEFCEPVAGLAHYRAQLRERRAVIGGARRAERLAVGRGGREADLEPVDGAQLQAAPSSRAPAGRRDRPGRAPEQLLHHLSAQPPPPACDHLAGGHLPALPPRHLRQQPGQAGHRLAVAGIGHQRHRQHQAGRQRKRHDPPALMRPGPAAGGNQALDHPLAQALLQYPEPHMSGKPPGGLHLAAAAHRRHCAGIELSQTRAQRIGLALAIPDEVLMSPGQGIDGFDFIGVGTDLAMIVAVNTHDLSQHLGVRSV